MNGFRTESGGKAIAPSSHWQEQLLHPTTHRYGSATIGLSAASSQPYTPCVQNSTHFRHPAHFAESMLGNHGI